MRAEIQIARGIKSGGAEKHTVRLYFRSAAADTLFMTTLAAEVCSLQSTPGLCLARMDTTQSVTTEEISVELFDRAVLSWNASGPVRLEMEVQGSWHAIACDDPQLRARSSNVDTDLLVLAKPANAFRLRAMPLPGTRLSLLALAHWMHGSREPFGDAPSAAWGEVLRVPERSQYSETQDAGRICSPTSLAMVLEYYGVRKSTREVAEGVYDPLAKIYGNWPFNTAYAHRLAKLEACVRRAGSLRELESEIIAGRPVIVSHAWKAGDLDGAPLPESKGHLVVVIGFSPQGDVIVNDPAGQPGSVRHMYKRRQFYTTWLERAQGIIYCLSRR
ncbi:MAG TPA: peptidase C39 family protein [Planctomycetota bacterium]|nr:peptidase C39 family protein [Planctomycetota bacterium]